MTTIVIKIKSKEEEDLLTRLFKKMNLDVQLIEEPVPNYETRKAINDVKNRKGTRVKDSDELFSRLTPMSIDQFNSENDKSMTDSEIGRITSAMELKKKANKWDGISKLAD